MCNVLKKRRALSVSHLTVSSSDAPLPNSKPTSSRSRVTLGVGEVHVTTRPCEIWTVLGSCVAVALYAPKPTAAAMCHAFLPRPDASPACDAVCSRPCLRAGLRTNELTYVSCCIAYMLNALMRRGIAATELVASVVGGATFRPVNHKESIGDQNVRVARELLRQHRICVAYENVGGAQGRTLLYHTATGTSAVRVHRMPAF